MAPNENGSSPAGLPITLPVVLDPSRITDVGAAQSRLAQAQARIQRTDSALGAQYDGTDPDYVQTEDRFESWSHQQIYNAVHGSGGIDLAGLQSLRKAWLDSQSELSAQATFTLSIGINRLMSSGEWSGASGDAARAASAVFARAAAQVAQVFEDVRDRTDAVLSVAEATRLAVTAPAGITAPDPDDPMSQIIPGLDNPATVTTDRTGAEKARLDAIAAMNNIYKPGYPPAGSGVPTYPTVQGVGDGGNPGSPAGGNPTSPGSGTAPQGTSPAGNQPDSPSTADEPSGQTTPSSDDTTTAGTTTTPDSGSTSPSSTSPSATTPSATTPSSAATSPGLGTNPNLGTGGRPTGSGTPGVPGSSGRSLNGPGTGAAAPGSAGTSGSGTRTGTTGMMGSPMGSSAAGRRGESESDHSSPDYLRRVYDDWTEGLEPTAELIDNPGAITETVDESPSFVRPAATFPPADADTTPVTAAAQATDAAAATDTTPATETAPTATEPLPTAIAPTAPSLSPEVAALMNSYDSWDTTPAEETQPAEVASAPADGTPEPSLPAHSENASAPARHPDAPSWARP